MSKVLNGTLDRRRVTGLKRAALRNLESEETMAIGNLLSQFHKQVESASLLAPKLFKSCPVEEMMQTLDMLEAEGVSFLSV